MANVIISSVCGLCAGCKRSIDTATLVASKNKTALFKEIVHNKNVNSMLQNLGIRTIQNLSDAKIDECVILRAHGEPPETYKFLNEHMIKFSDCTCPNVTKIHDLVHEFSSNGYEIILIGKYGKTNGKVHPEVLGTIGWCAKQPILIEDEEDALYFKPKTGEKYYLVCQTTFNESKADKFIDIISKACSLLECEIVLNKSICFAQKSINTASVELAKKSNIMIVVGGKNSSNTKELFNVLNEITNTIFVEDITEYKKELLENNYSINSSTKIGITAGASTMKEELQELKQLIISEFE